MQSRSIINGAFIRKASAPKNLPYGWLFSSSSDARGYATLAPGELLVPKENLELCQMDEKNLKVMTKYTAEEGWNPGKHEAGALLAAAGKGFKLLKINEEPVACLCSTRYKNFAFLGHYFVRPEFRGKGFGKLVWDATLGELADCRTIGLNAVIEQIQNYEKSGFCKTQNYNIRWFGFPQKINSYFNHSDISLKENFSISTLIDYDATIFSTPRAAFLSKWVAMPESRTLAAIDKEGNLKGYACVSVSNNGYKIAPLFADNMQIAEQLYNGIVSFIDGRSSIYFDTSETNSAASIFAKKIGLKELFRSLPMWKGGPHPNADCEKTYLITSQELGIL